jgi:hypothetical protein
LQMRSVGLNKLVNFSRPTCVFPIMIHGSCCVLVRVVRFANEFYFSFLMWCFQDLHYQIIRPDDRFDSMMIRSHRRCRSSPIITTHKKRRTFVKFEREPVDVLERESPGLEEGVGGARGIFRVRIAI